MKKIKRQLSLFLIAPFIVACGGDGGGGGGSFSPSPPNRDNYAPPSPPTGDRSGGGSFSPPPPVVPPKPTLPLNPVPDMVVSQPKVSPSTRKNNFDREVYTKYLFYNKILKQNNNIDNASKFINDPILNHYNNNNKIIAVIDTNFVDSKLYGNRFEKIRCLIYDQNCDKNKYVHPHEHGAIVSDIVARNNKSSKILGYSIDDQNIAFDHYKNAYEKGARIFNNSFTTSQLIPEVVSPYLGLLKDRILNDSIIVWAAGNIKEGEEHDFSKINEGTHESVYPSTKTGKEKDKLRASWVSVAAIWGENSDRLADFSYAIGEKAKTWGIAANGSYVTSIQNQQEYSINRGTSFAAPRVTAAVANIWNKFPWMSNHLVLVTLFSTANKPGTNELTDGPNAAFGWGVLNEERSLKGPAFLSKDLLINYDNYDEILSNTYYRLKVKVSNRNYIDEQITWSNDISGDAGILKTGEGKLILSGVNGYSGGTVVDQGELVVTNKLYNADIFIRSNGIFTAKSKQNDKQVEVGLKQGSVFKNYGVLKVYGKGLVINGNYESESSPVQKNTMIIIDIDKSKLTVTGTANLQNTTIEADVENTSLYKSNVTRSILVAGSISGFNNSNTCQKGSKSYIKEFSCSNESNKINATYTLNNTAQALAKVLNIETLSTNDSQFYENAADLIDLNLDYLAQNNIKSLSASKLLSSNSNEIKQNVEQIAAKIYPENQDYISQKNQILVNNISNKVYKSLDKDSSFYTEILSSNLNSKTKADTKAFLAGFNYKVNSDFALGFAFSNDNSKLNFLDDSNKKDENEIFANFINLYSAKNFDNFYTSANLNLGIISNRLKRNVIDSVISNNYDTKILNLYTELGKNFKFNNFKFSPYLLANFEKQFLSDFNEKGSDFAIKTKNVNFNNANLGLGFRLDLEFDKLNLSANLRHLRAVNSRNFDFSAKNINDADIKIKGKKMAKYFNFIETDAFYNLNKKISLNFALSSSFEENKNLNNNFKFGLFYKI